MPETDLRCFVCFAPTPVAPSGLCSDCLDAIERHDQRVTFIPTDMVLNALAFAVCAGVLTCMFFLM